MGPKPSRTWTRHGRLWAISTTGDAVLVKGSRVAGLEALAEALAGS